MTAKQRGPRHPEATRRCAAYIRKAGSLPAGKALAKKDGFSANTSIWIGALGDCLDVLAAADKQK